MSTVTVPLSDGSPAHSLTGRPTSVPLPSAGESQLGIGELFTTVPEEANLPCQTEDPDLWFAEGPADLQRAKQFCGGCPVRAACLAGAIARREPWGVWGGEIFERGDIIARKRPRGRPRKSDTTTTALNGAKEKAA
ncbi:WhiB family transcriptional regulator [Actinoalloteichus sp. AHMU CJ021]|uniref:Transcriptional regulator WhiB n=1 Tax=Actinoalloteichus caeruleus DSM 43889 TaxID=1120930 RepID=A0ABT1JIV9_ACTCY|nr:WhiB family transcriptional regulator [Actinoalloteichus caeruleus]AUS78189.1 WhiB family transcriptional regulator [Actinoalloteichus sp. AHMU CJ021]MCP2332224.1 WhiB family transcriptional regulator, redox-sensing transcriptional regulator [Actinoalloteichus caeruleus DSM 43889]